MTTTKTASTSSSKKTPETWVVTVVVQSPKGTKPAVDTICDDTVFVWLDEGQTAKWTVKKHDDQPAQEVAFRVGYQRGLVASAGGNEDAAWLDYQRSRREVPRDRT